MANGLQRPVKSIDGRRFQAAQPNVMLKVPRMNFCPATVTHMGLQNVQRTYLQSCISKNAHLPGGYQ